MRDESGVFVSSLILHPSSLSSFFAFLFMSDYHYASFYFNRNYNNFRIERRRL